jgi:hypothetical protein
LNLDSPEVPEIQEADFYVNLKKPTLHAIAGAMSTGENWTCQGKGEHHAGSTEWLE